MSLRVRLALIVAMGCAAIITAGGLVFLHELSAGLRSSLVVTLHARTSAVAQNLDAGAGPNVQDPGASSPGAGTTAQTDAFLQVIGTHGTMVDGTGARSGAPVLSRAELAAARRSELVVQRSLSRGEPPALLLAVPAGDGSGSVIIAGTSLDTVDQALSRVTAALLIGGPVAVVLAGLGAWLLAGAAIAPVERMRRQAAEISARDSGAALSVPGTKDEVAALARTLNDMLARLHRALSRQRGFLAVAGHELRTPLAVLKSEIELARAPGRTLAELRAALAVAGGETDRVIRLAEDLLLLAGSDEDVPLVHLQPQDIVPVVAGVAESWTETARRQGVGVRFTGPARLITAADADRFRQIIDNLVDNALRFSPPGSVIEVRLRAVGGRAGSGAGGGAELAVADSGPGFPPEFLPVAFERFSRPDGSQGDQDGSGLGLAIVKTLAEAHHGQASAFNQPSGGAVVRVLLPPAPGV